MTVHVNSFTHRQTESSRFSYYDGSFENLAALVEANMPTTQPTGHVLVVSVPPENFFSGIVKLKEGDKLVGGFEPRQAGEAPRQFVMAVGAEKMSAKAVDIILYSSKELSKKGQNELPPEDGNWEVISINARACEGDEPIHYMTLLYNLFELDGGTNPNYSSLEEAFEAVRKSVVYWKDKANCAGS